MQLWCCTEDFLALIAAVMTVLSAIMVVKVFSAVEVEIMDVADPMCARVVVMHHPGSSRVEEAVTSLAPIMAFGIRPVALKSLSGSKEPAA